MRFVAIAILDWLSVATELQRQNTANKAVQRTGSYCEQEDFDSVNALEYADELRARVPTIQAVCGKALARMGRPDPSSELYGPNRHRWQSPVQVPAIPSCLLGPDDTEADST
jgi:hypothetical protein